MRAESEGLPLSQSQLKWHVTNGTLRDASPKTDENGEGSAIFSTTDLVQGIVEVTAEKMGYKQATTDVIFTVSLPIDNNMPGPELFGIFPVRLVFLAVVLILVGYVGMKLFQPLRRNLSGFRQW